jgi:hypothetical protein
MMPPHNLVATLKQVILTMLSVGIILMLKELLKWYCKAVKDHQILDLKI